MGHWSYGISTVAVSVSLSFGGWLCAQSDEKIGPPALYTAAQAKGGGVVYHEQCADCHANDLSGAMAPALKGDSFWNSWDQKPARALYSRILTSMPARDPGSLSEKEVLAIVAYILQGNGFPAGEKAIEGARQLENVKLERPK